MESNAQYDMKDPYIQPIQKWISENLKKREADHRQQTSLFFLTSFKGLCKAKSNQIFDASTVWVVFHSTEQGTNNCLNLRYFVF